MDRWSDFPPDNPFRFRYYTKMHARHALLCLPLLLTARAAVVINEVHYDSEPSLERAEFIELHNTGPDAVDLTGWHFEDGIQFVFPTGTVLQAGAFLVLAENLAGFHAKFNPPSAQRELARMAAAYLELPRRGVKIISVEITADEAVIESRIASKQRLQFKKLTDVVLYRQLRDSGVFTTPLIPRTDLRVDTGKASPAEAARQIASHSRLI